MTETTVHGGAEKTMSSGRKGGGRSGVREEMRQRSKKKRLTALERRDYLFNKKE